ncbi:MAG: response regulator [Candidatus Latescibacteria bacterium]|nr:response regulator [Candidatus Latescibacterota bacterium]
MASNLTGQVRNVATVIPAVANGDLTRKVTAEAQGEIQQAADRGAGLVRQLLAFSRKQVLEPVVLNLNTVVRDLEKMLRRLIGEDVELIAKIAPALGQVKADPGQLEQVLVNLAVNARDAMPQGGQLTIETSNAELDELYAANHMGVKPGPYVLLEASRGEEALRLAARHQGAIHLVVTDMVMPGMGGRELVQQLTAARSSFKTLYISGYSAEVIERQGTLEPGMLFLQKPFKANALLLKVREALDRKG